MMASLFGGMWFCLLLAGLWSLLCGYFLRRAWTAEADQESALRMASLRNDTARLRAEVEARNAQVKTLETDLGGERQRSHEIQSLLDGKDTELLTLGSRLASVEAKAAGFDYARLSSLRLIEEREQAIAGLNTKVQSLQAELREASAAIESERAAHTATATAAAAELAAQRKSWDADRAQLSAEHSHKLGLLESAQLEADQSKGSEINTLLAKVAGLAAFESQARDLASKLEASAAALSAKNKDMAALEQRLRALEPLQAKLATAETELAAATRHLAERDQSLTALTAQSTRDAQALKQRDDESAHFKTRLAGLEPLPAQLAQADAELGRLRAQTEALEPWRSQAEAANAELARARARVGELEPLQNQLASAGAELAALRSRLGELEPLKGKLDGTTVELAAARSRLAELEPWKQKFSEAETELGRLRARLAAAEPWQARFEAAGSDLARLRAQVGELEPWQGKFTQADAELARLRARVAELQPLQEQLRSLGADHAVALKQRDDPAAQLDAEARARTGLLEAERADWRRRGEMALGQLAAKEAEIRGLARELESLRQAPPRGVEKIVEVKETVAVAAPAAAPRPTATPKPRSASTDRRDDLKVVEGIGPKIEKLLNDAGYWTFRSVADADPAALALILEAAGPRFKLARTETWPEQAALLADNRMEEFKKLTDELKGGMRR